MNLCFKISVFMLLSLVLFDCKGPKGEMGPTGPSGSSLRGDLIGTVKLYDEFGDPIYNNCGVIVRINHDTLQTTSDTTGKWMFPSLKAGLYSISYEKVGFGIFKQYNFQFIGGGAVYVPDISLYQIPNYNLNMGSGPIITSRDTIACYIKGASNNINRRSRSVRWFVVYETNNFDSTFIANGFPYILTKSSTSTTDSFAVYVPIAVLRSLGVKSGVYIDIWPCPESSSISYRDPLTGLDVYPFIAKPHSGFGYIMP